MTRLERAVRDAFEAAGLPVEYHPWRELAERYPELHLPTLYSAVYDAGPWTLDAAEVERLTLEPPEGGEVARILPKDDALDRVGPAPRHRRVDGSPRPYEMVVASGVEVSPPSPATSVYCLGRLLEWLASTELSAPAGAALSVDAAQINAERSELVAEAKRIVCLAGWRWSDGKRRLVRVEGGQQATLRLNRVIGRVADLVRDAGNLYGNTREVHEGVLTILKPVEPDLGRGTVRDAIANRDKLRRKQEEKSAGRNRPLSADSG